VNYSLVVGFLEVLLMDSQSDFKIWTLTTTHDTKVILILTEKVRQLIGPAII